MSAYGHHQMVNTEIRLTIFFAPEDRSSIQSAKATTAIIPQMTLFKLIPKEVNPVTKHMSSKDH